MLIDVTDTHPIYIYVLDHIKEIYFKILDTTTNCYKIEKTKLKTKSTHKLFN